MSEEDEDEDEEEGKTAVQADEKMKNNKPGLHGALLSSWKVQVQLLCAGFNALSPLPDVMVSRKADRERVPVRYCSLGTRDATRYPPPFRRIRFFKVFF